MLEPALALALGLLDPGPGGPASLTSQGPGLVALLDEAARLGAATLAGAALGANRNLRGKAAGLRTHALVALGAAAATTAAGHLGAAGDATRVIQGVITGIGFLGAGVILHPRTAPPAEATPAARPAAPPGGGEAAGGGRRARNRDVRGLTTAATIWVAAVLGLAAGLGLWSLTLLAALLTLTVLALGGSVEEAVRRRFQRLSRARRASRRARRGRRADRGPRRPA